MTTTELTSGQVSSVPHGGSGAEFAVLDPATGRPLTSYALATAADVDAAAAAARRAFADWSRTTPAERSSLLGALAAELQQRADELAAVETAQTGKLSTGFDVPGTIDNAAFFAGAARVLEGSAAGEYSPDHTSMVRREPVGVVGSVAPWNYPLQLAGWKVFPAVAAGNTVVLKPAEITPLTAVLLAEAAAAVGFPAGVISVVAGTGPEAGAALVGHPGVDMVSFTGSTAVGRQVMAACAGRGARVHLELGGKAPFVVFDDADLEAAVHGAVAASLINSGQDCTAATRAYVHTDRLADFVSGVGDLYAGVRLGAPADEATDLGPLSSAGHRDKVAGMVAAARAGGATVRQGAAVPGGDLADEFRFPPTLVTGVGPPRPGRPAGGLRPGADRDRVRQRRRGAPAGQRQPVRTGGVGLDPGPAPGAALRRRAAGRHGLGQRPHPDLVGDAARRLRPLRFRRGHVGLLTAGVQPGQARGPGPHRAGAETVAPRGVRPFRHLRHDQPTLRSQSCCVSAAGRRQDLRLEFVWPRTVPTMPGGVSARHSRAVGAISL
jgi:betaine-aldehyde dehydrogenase